MERFVFIFKKDDKHDCSLMRMYLVLIYVQTLYIDIWDLLDNSHILNINVSIVQKHTTIEPKTNVWGNYVNNVSSLLVIHLSMWNTPRCIAEVWFAMNTWSVTVVVTWLLVIITDSFTCTLRNIGIQFGIILILKNKWRQKTWNERCTIRHTSVKSATPGIPLIEHLVSNSGYSFHLFIEWIYLPMILKYLFTKSPYLNIDIRTIYSLVFLVQYYHPKCTHWRIGEIVRI